LVKSLTATISISGLPSDARNTLRPMRPKPLIPTFTAIEAFLLRLISRKFFQGRGPELANRNSEKRGQPLQPPCSHANTTVNDFRLCRNSSLHQMPAKTCRFSPNDKINPAIKTHREQPQARR